MLGRECDDSIERIYISGIGKEVYLFFDKKYFKMDLIFFKAIAKAPN